MGSDGITSLPPAQTNEDKQQAKSDDSKSDGIGGIIGITVIQQEAQEEHDGESAAKERESGGMPQV